MATGNEKRHCGLQHISEMLLVKLKQTLLILDSNDRPWRNLRFSYLIFCIWITVLSSKLTCFPELSSHKPENDLCTMSLSGKHNSEDGVRPGRSLISRCSCNLMISYAQLIQSCGILLWHHMMTGKSVEMRWTFPTHSHQNLIQIKIVIKVGIELLKSENIINNIYTTSMWLFKVLIQILLLGNIAGSCKRVSMTLVLCSMHDKSSVG